MTKTLIGGGTLLAHAAETRNERERAAALVQQESQDEIAERRDLSEELLARTADRKAA